MSGEPAIQTRALSRTLATATSRRRPRRRPEGHLRRGEVFGFLGPNGARQDDDGADALGTLLHRPRAAAARGQGDGRRSEQFADDVTPQHRARASTRRWGSTATSDVRDGELTVYGAPGGLYDDRAARRSRLRERLAADAPGPDDQGRASEAGRDARRERLQRRGAAPCLARSSLTVRRVTFDDNATADGVGGVNGVGLSGQEPRCGASQSRSGIDECFDQRLQYFEEATAPATGLPMPIGGLQRGRGRHRRRSWRRVRAGRRRSRSSRFAGNGDAAADRARRWRFATGGAGAAFEWTAARRTRSSAATSWAKDRAARARSEARRCGT